MRKSFLLLPMLLSACSTAPAQPPVRGETPGRGCRSDQLARFAGRTATAEIGSEILRASGAAHLRWVGPGMRVTMEFREDRVTVWLGTGNVIDRVSCG